ncbi:hypothetical protein BASA60_002505 [Batrachochytrium salamandrivorans]|nr:hypothetical protein BASA60_002505 [Batrachochytrium salamandrivorans]
MIARSLLRRDVASFPGGGVGRSSSTLPPVSPSTSVCLHPVSPPSMPCRSASVSSAPHSFRHGRFESRTLHSRDRHLLFVAPGAASRHDYWIRRIQRYSQAQCRSSDQGFGLASTAPGTTILATPSYCCSQMESRESIVTSMLHMLTLFRYHRSSSLGSMQYDILKETDDISLAVTELPPPQQQQHTLVAEYRISAQCGGGTRRDSQTSYQSSMVMLCDLMPCLMEGCHGDCKDNLSGVIPQRG